jgi:hypothetical protein
MQVITDLDRRIGYVYDLATKVTTSWACQWQELGKWGIKDRGTQMQLLQDMGALYLYLAMLEWKAWEHNTFYLTYDDNNCPEWKYPSMVADPDTIECIIKHYHCNGVDIRNILRKWGVLPLGLKPDGIDYMHIQVGFAPCDDRRFQIDKPYGTDYVTP